MTSFAIHSAGQWLGKLVVQEVQSLIEVKDNVEKIQRKLEWMQCFLSDADAKQSSSALIRKWILEISNLALKAEDLTETYILKVSHKRQDGYINGMKWIGCCWMDAKTLHILASQIDSLTSKIAEIASNQQAYGVQSSYAASTSETTSARKSLADQRRTYAHGQPDFIVGIEEDVTTLIKQLEQDSQKILVMGGMGGMGKTALAREVYQKCLSQGHFVGCGWAYVSQQFDLGTVCKELCNEILSTDNEKKNEISGLDVSQLPGKICEILKSKNYLVVLDDLWKVEDWRRLEAALPIHDSSCGSKILITTRNPQIFSNLGGNLVSNWTAKSLDENSCWKLLENKGCFERKSLDSLREEVAQKMLDHCKGHPLAIVALGGVLANKQSLKEWESVFDNLQSHLQGYQNSYIGVYDVLAMSYNDLDYSLKACFLHMGHFPEDYRIDVEKLYHLWIADGIVSSTQNQIGKKRSLEDIADDFLNQLVHKAMIKADDKDISGRIHTCSLHDLMRDMCLKMTISENFLQIVNINVQQTFQADARTEKARRLTMYVGNEDAQSVIESLSDKIESLRSLFFISTSGDRKEDSCAWIKLICKKFKLLRVLDFEGGVILEGPLPKQVGNLLYLKYLCLQGSRVTSLPSSIKNLKSLLILDIRVKGVIIKVPNVLWEMSSLCHLYFPYLSMTQETSKHDPWTFKQGYQIKDGSLLILDKLTKLERVDEINLDEVDVNGLVGLTSMKKVSAFCKHKKENLLPFLKSSSIKQLDLKLDAGLLTGDSNMLLSESSSIRKLDIDAAKSPPTYLTMQVDMFPCNLVDLGIWYCLFEEDPMPVLEKLPKLKLLRLSICYRKAVMNCSDIAFPELTYLMLDGLFNLKQWNVERGGFPKLLVLEVNNCPIENIPNALPSNVDIRGTSDIQPKVVEFRRQANLNPQHERGIKWKFVNMSWMRSNQSLLGFYIVGCVVLMTTFVYLLITLLS